MPLTKNKLKELRQLTSKKHRDESDQFIIEGVRLVQEAVQSDYTIQEAFYTRDLEESAGGTTLLQTLKKKTANLFPVTTREMEVISETVTFQGIVAVLRQKHFTIEMLLKKNSGQSRLVAFDSVSDPGNVGSMVRTCDWFGVDGVLLGGSSVDLYNPKVLRATMGGVFHLPIAEGVDLLSTLSRAKGMGYKVYVTDIRSETHFDRVKYEHKAIIVFGNEAWGVSDQVKDLADTRVSIRRYGAAESLNVSVACGVVLSGLHRLFDE
ncbi:MAG TPA: RNA methyltransferase [Bacteroidota bacterium]|nr:RNA methyltransferase [Bacteroidota bacterium]